MSKKDGQPRKRLGAFERLPELGILEQFSLSFLSFRNEMLSVERLHAFEYVWKTLIVRPYQLHQCQVRMMLLRAWFRLYFGFYRLNAIPRMYLAPTFEARQFYPL